MTWKSRMKKNIVYFADRLYLPTAIPIVVLLIWKILR